MTAALLASSAAFLVVTGIAHSVLGEQFLLRPLLARSDGVLRSRLARFLLRFAWHITSIAFAAIAIVLATLAFDPPHVFRNTTLAVGLSFLASGLFDAWGSRGRHIGWPLLTAVGVAALAALAVGD